MDIGLNITDRVRVRINEDLSELQDQLENCGIRYSIPFKESVDGITREILIIDSYGVEIKTSGERITFIKTSNSKSNYVAQIKDTKPLDALNSIKSVLAEKFSCEEKSIKVNTFDIASYNSVMTIPMNNTAMAKLTLVMGTHGKIYLETIRMINK